MVLLPAPDCDYRTFDEVQRALMACKAFVIGDETAQLNGCLTNAARLLAAGYTRVQVRFAKGARTAVIDITDLETYQ